MKRVDIRNFIIFFISVVVLITACIRNNSDSIYYDGDFTIASAKNWYDENKSGFDQMTNVDIFKTGNYTPLWDKAQLMEDSLYDVIEIPLKFKKSIGINVHQQSQNGADTTNIASLTKLLILKSKNTNELIGSLMNIHFDNGVIDYNIGYNKNTRQSFSGNIFYTRLNGEFVNGWMYKNGEIVKYANTAHETSTSATKRNLYGSNVQGKNYNIADRQMMSAGKQAATLNDNKAPTSAYDASITDDERCMTTVVQWYERNCWLVGNIEQCTEWTYLYSDYYTYCNYGGTSDGGGYNNYTTKTVPPPCLCDNNPDSIKIDTTLKIFPCALSILDTLLDLNVELTKILKDIYGVDETVANLYFKADFSLGRLNGDGTVSDGYTRDIQDPSEPQIISFNRTVYLNPWVMNNSTNEYIVGTIIHEAFHSIVDRFYYQAKYYPDYGGNDMAWFKTKFPLVWEAKTKGQITEGDADHTQMANEYVSEIANVIKAYNPIVDISIVRSIAWAGLQGTSAWRALKADTTRIMNEINSARRTFVQETDSTFKTSSLTKCN